MYARLTFVIALVVAAAPAAAEEAPPRVGVVIELAVNVEPARADALGAALADALNRELRVDAFGGEDVARQLPAEGLPDECVARADCIADVARRLDADELLFLVLVQVGDDVQVDASWVDVATGKTTSRPRIVLRSDARAVSVFAAAASRYLPDAEERPDQAIVVGGPAAPTTTPRAMTTPAWITAGVAGAGLVAGTVLGLGVRSDFQRCERAQATPMPCPDDELDGIERRALLADVSLGVAAGAAVATVILYLRSGGEPAEPAPVHVSPASGGAVVGISGRW